MCVNVSPCLSSISQFICWIILHTIYISWYAKRYICWKEGLDDSKKTTCLEKCKRKFWGCGYRQLFPFHVGLCVRVAQTQIIHTNRCPGCCCPALCIAGWLPGWHQQCRVGKQTAHNITGNCTTWQHCMTCPVTPETSIYLIMPSCTYHLGCS